MYEVSRLTLNPCFAMDTMRCPFCGSDDIESDDFNFVAQDTLLESCQCNECDYQWYNEYKLYGQESVE